MNVTFEGVYDTNVRGWGAYRAVIRINGSVVWESEPTHKLEMYAIEHAEGHFLTRMKQVFA